MVKPVRGQEQLPGAWPDLSTGEHKWRLDANSPEVTYFINTIDDQVTQFVPASSSSGASGSSPAKSPLVPWAKAALQQPRAPGLAATAGPYGENRTITTVLLYLSGSDAVPLRNTSLAGTVRRRIHKNVVVVNVQIVKGTDITSGKRTNWKARPPKWLLAFIDSLKQSCNQRGMQLVVVGFSRGSMWLSLLAHLIGVDDGPIAHRMAMIGHYPEPGKTADQLKEEAAQIKCPLLMLSSRNDLCCPYSVSAPYIDMVLANAERVHHSVIVKDGLTHEQLFSVLTGQLDKAHGLTDSMWDFLIGT